ncbi:helix-hairpin-helix domain-containing protein [Stigmatella sp. ncwal1]|uniref:Helix-hairpin-helix domain-containing protein n=1 Tax=Stigmatella ashevillensis TaxID=2995309 RepID=A0ABT5D0D9_9BACT|nr:helix-hairpin-helix domain-containing protein [Stigmatella ashevillena]MDC0707046.1 helix-hairpin-helix domain-containing protein [Stigmatella ashevillena]
MIVNRTGSLAAATLGLMVLGGLARWTWPSPSPALDCEPASVRMAGGIARCGEGTAPTGAQAVALGLKLDLNAASEEELAQLSGVGRSLARKLVEAREAQGRFASWEEVDAVSGVGPGKLETLRATTELRETPPPGGVW